MQAFRDQREDDRRSIERLDTKPVLDDSIRVQAVVSPRYLAKYSLGFEDISPVFQRKVVKMDPITVFDKTRSKSRKNK